MGLVLLLGSAVALGGLIEEVFQVPAHGSRLLFLAVTALYVFASASLGLVIAVLSRNLGQVVMWVLLLMMPLLPAPPLSGVSGGSLVDGKRRSVQGTARAWR